MSQKIYIVMGVSGCGKTTIAKGIADKLKIPFHDADDFHPPENKDKMRNGIPLNDDDRIGWLQNLNNTLRKEANQKGTTLACSALKEKYRQQLIKDIDVEIIWIILKGNFDTIYTRMKKRKDHYMPASLLQSQFDAIEYPDYGITFSILDDPDDIVNNILSL